MNIFYLDDDPHIAAQYLHDVHVNKMLIETCQILITNNRCLGDDFSKWGDYVKYRTEPYKSTHVNHPCCKWARFSVSNYAWLLGHGEALAAEFKFRHNKKHKCEQVIRYLMSVLICNKISGPSYMTPPVLCMPQKFEVPTGIVDSYRNYYNEAKFKDKNGKRIDVWTKREKPFWWVDILEKSDML